MDHLHLGPESLEPSFFFSSQLLLFAQVDRQSGRITAVKALDFLPAAPPKEKGPFPETWQSRGGEGLARSDSWPTVWQWRSTKIMNPRSLAEKRQLFLQVSRYLRLAMHVLPVLAVVYEP